MMKLSEYFSDRTKVNSVLKNVPMESEAQYAAVRAACHEMCKKLNVESIFTVKPRFVFRGPRRKVTPFWSDKQVYADRTAKADANSFDVYLDIKMIAKGFSWEQQIAFGEAARARFSERTDYGKSLMQA